MFHSVTVPFTVGIYIYFVCLFKWKHKNPLREQKEEMNVGFYFSWFFFKGTNYVMHVYLFEGSLMERKARVSVAIRALRHGPHPKSSLTVSARTQLCQPTTSRPKSPTGVMTSYLRSACNTTWITQPTSIRLLDRQELKIATFFARERYFLRMRH